MNGIINGLGEFFFRRYGKKKDVTSKLKREFYGEIPPNTPFTYIVQQTELIFVVVDPINEMGVYHATRAALLYILNHCERPRGAVSSRRCKSSSTDKQSSRNLLDDSVPIGIHRSGTNSGHVNTPFHITIHIAANFRGIPQEKCVWQMAQAYHKMIHTCRKTLSASNLDQRYKKVLSCPTLETRQKYFIESVKRTELVRRGLFSDTEVDLLLHWISDESQLPMRMAAVVAIVQYIQCDKYVINVIDLYM